MAVATAPGPCTSAHAWPKQTNPILSNRLSSFEIFNISIIGAELPRHLKAVKDLREANSELRQKISKVLALSHPTVLSRCVAWAGALFGARQPGPEMLKRSFQGEISANVEKIKHIARNKIEPVLEEIRLKHHGKTFFPTKDTPQPLLMAAIPTEKIGKIPSHIDLMIRVQNYHGSSDISRSRVTANTLGERMVITRLNKNNEEEILEVSYRRQGKVDVTITSKSGVTEKSVWNDDAEGLCQAFIDGKPIRFVPKRYKEYTVTNPTA